MKNLVLVLLITLASSVCYSQQWDLLTPLEVNRDITGCSFINQSKGAAVMETGGNVLFTENGGRIWRKSRIPGSNTDLEDVEMPDSDIVLACGEEGIIFKTPNFGEIWEVISLPTAEPINALEFTTPAIGYGVGGNGVIIKTEDAGTTWVELVSGTSEMLLDVQFSSELLGYACGFNGTIIKTEDGGENWESLVSGTENTLVSMTVPADEVIFACGWYQTIIGSSDGGASFVLQFEGTGIGSLNFIEFKDELKGWAAGNWGKHVITNDGGATWNETEVLGFSNIHSGQYVNEETSFLMGRNIMLGSSSDTDDWHVLKNTVPNSNYKGLYFHDDLNGHIVGSTGAGASQGAILATHDGGQTWDVQGSSGAWTDIHFADENFGTAKGLSIAKTSNGGDDWAGTSSSESLTGGATWWFNSDEGVVGGDGLFHGICKTTNGGTSYTCDSEKSAGDFFFINDNLGYAVSENGSERLFRTTDGGDSWEFVSSGNGQSKHSVFFLNENDGWVGAYFGTVLRTTDGGETWSSSLVGYTVVGIRFYDENNGFCVDSFGNIYKSSNGGANWELFLNSDELNGVFVYEGFFTENYVYIGSQSGRIYKCELGCAALPNPAISLQKSWCTGVSVEVLFESSELVQDYEWTFPEDWVVEENEESLTVTPGLMDGLIRLDVINNCGIISSSELGVTIPNNAMPAVELVVSGPLCIGSNFQLFITDSAEGEEFIWDYPEGWEGVLTGDTLTLTIGSAEGWVSAVRDSDCEESESYFLTVTGLALPEVSFNLEDETIICDNTQLVLEGGLPEGGIFFGDYVENGLLDLAGTNEAETIVSYLVLGENGCSAVATDTFEIRPSEIIGGDWDPLVSFPCGGELLFGLNGMENFDGWITDYPTSWMDVTQFSGSNPLYSVEDAFESGEIIITLTNECGTEKVFTTLIDILEPPSVPVIAGSIESWCENSSAAIDISVGESDSLIWSVPDLTAEMIQDDNNYSLNLSGESGVYTLTASAENECGSSVDTIITYEVLELPEVSLTFGSDTLCTEQSSPAFVFPEGGEFTGPGASGMVIQSFFLSPGETYDYVYIYTDDNGCSNSAQESVYFEVCVGVGEIQGSSPIVYPNPASDQLILEFDNAADRQIRIIGLNGILVHSLAGNEKELVLDISNYSIGEYYIVIEGRGYKFIKE